MKTLRYIAAALLLSSFVMADAKSDKRGVSENQFSMGSMLEALEPGVTWYYNWGNTPGKGYENQVIDFEDIEFVPMCWNANYNADAIREYCKTHPKTKYLLGFNEPNFTAQANMTPQKAAEEWPKVKALADELGLKLVAPALNYSPNPPYTDPLKWMDEFVALVGLDAFDFTAVHNYGGLGVMKTIAGNFHDKYGKPVWVTEFCYWPNEGSNNSYVSPETQISSMAETLQWLETTPWIFRYAWFKALGNYNSTTGPNYGLLKHEGAGTDPWTLSDQGKVYVGLPTFDQNVWHPVQKTVPASELVSSNMVGFNGTNDDSNPSIIEISKFNAGASATWQFEIQDSGQHYITLRVSGFGEPTRFNPTLKWVRVDGDKEIDITGNFNVNLPNSDTEYVAVTSTVDLPAGKNVIRLKDMAPYQPSGIKISTIRVDNVAGVDDAISSSEEAVGAVYNLQGIKVLDNVTVEEAGAELPAGIYIKNGKKFIVR